MELKYVIGDKVLVEVTIVNTDNREERLPYEIGVYGERYWVEESDLHGSISEKKSPTTWDNIEVGDVIGTLGNALYTVKTLAEDRVFVRESVGYALHKDIDTIYKKSWEKPKELEEMSKEELIELVKKLKGD